MIISPKKAFDKQYVSNLVNPDKQIGSDGIDLTLKSIEKVDLTDTAVLSEDKTLNKHRAREPVEITFENGKAFYVLSEGVYDVSFNEHFNLPKKVAATIMLRSSLVRNGNIGAAGLYDSGFNAPGGMFVHVRGGGKIKLEQDVRIAQAVFHESNTHKLYNGQYNNQSHGNWLTSWMNTNHGK